MTKSLAQSFLLSILFLSTSLVISHSQASDGAFCSTLADANAQPIGATKPEDAGKDQAGKGLDGDCSQIRSAVEQRINAQISSWRQTGLQAPNYEKISEGYNKYKNNRSSCLNGQARAATICLEGWSPNLAETSAQVNVVLSTLGSQATNESCGKFGKAMKIAQAGLTAYAAACGIAKAGCGLGCVQARNGLESMKKAIQADSSSASCPAGSGPECAASLTAYGQLLSQASAAVDNELVEADKRSIAGKASTCNSKYGALAASALAGTAGLLGAFKQGDACKEQTAATDALEDITAKCALEENASLPDCICLKNPRTPGCSNAYEKMASGEGASGLSVGATERTNAIGAAGADLGGDTNTGIQQAEHKASSGAGLPGAPQGGGPGIGSGGGGGAGRGNQAGNAAAGKGLDTNILSGTGGGGGGGGFARGISSADSNGYRAYLPGGKQDPSKGIAGQQAWTREVTGQGGKSNFDKVKERYRDNKNTLLGN